MGTVNSVAQAVQQGDSYEGTPINPVAEAVRGLARDRTILIRKIRDCNQDWIGFPEFKREHLGQIAAIDARIDALLARKEGD